MPDGKEPQAEQQYLHRPHGGAACPFRGTVVRGWEGISLRPENLVRAR